MKTRPMSITLVAFFYLATPLVWLAIANRFAPLSAGPTGRDVLALSLFPMAAVGVYSVRRWGWYLFLAISAFAAADSLWVHSLFRPGSALPSLVFTGTAVATLCATVCRRHVESPYFNPRLRWWETANRYRVNLTVRLFTREGEIDGAVMGDISTGGCFVKVPRALKIGERAWVVIACAGKELSCLGRVVRKGDDNGNGCGYGIMFGAIPPSTRRLLRRLIRALENLGGRDRRGFVPAALIPSAFHLRRRDLRTCAVLPPTPQRPLSEPAFLIPHDPASGPHAAR